MATIEWRQGKRGTYAYLNWSDNEGQHRKSLGAVTKEQAEAELYAKEYELRTGKKIISTAPLIGVVAVLYLDWHKTEYPDSHFRVKEIVETHIVPAFRYVAADQLEPLQVERWKADRMQAVAASTVAKEVRTLKAMLNFAARTRVISHNPVQYVEPPQDRRSRPIHWYEMEQLQALYDATASVSPLRKATWQLMANTGLRCAEARYLKPEHDKGESIILVSEPGARTKSRKWREVPLSVNGRAALDVLLANNTTGYVLPVTTKNRMTMAFRRDRDRAGLGGSAHSLRHTFGTHQALKGTPIRVLQQLMGHASIKTTEKYLHVAEQHLKQAMQGFNL